MEDVRHQSLEAHVFDSGDVLGPSEVVRGAIFAALTSVVHHCNHVSMADHNPLPLPEYSPHMVQLGWGRTILRALSMPDSKRGGLGSSCLGDLSQSPALFPEVYDHTAATILGFLDRFFDSEDQVRSAGAYVGAEYITAITLSRN